MFELVPRENEQLQANALVTPAQPPDASAFDGFASGTGQYAMRSLAETARAISLAGAAIPITVDALTGSTVRQDAYFEAHDGIFQSAVEHWTPAPGDVGVAGEITGQLVGGALQAIVSPALLVATEALTAAEDLTRSGVDPGTAAAVGSIIGTGTAVGVKLPFLGDTLAKRVATGAAGNVAQGVATEGAAGAVLSATGNSEQAQQFDAFDLRARVLDVALGVAFGGLAHIEAGRAPEITAEQKDALLTANQARHMEQDTMPGKPASDADTSAHVDAMGTAVDQLLRGERVRVDGSTPYVDSHPDFARAQHYDDTADQMSLFAAEELPPVEPVRVAEAEIRADATDPLAAFADDVLLREPELRMSTDTLDADGNPVTVRVADLLQEARERKAFWGERSTQIFQAAADCLKRTA